MSKNLVARFVNGGSHAPAPFMAFLLLLTAGLWLCCPGAHAAPDTDSAPAQAPAPQPQVAQPAAGAEAAPPAPPAAAAPKPAEKPPKAQRAKPAPMKVPASLPAATESELRDKWGIEVLSLRRTAGEFMIDFRYRVLDPEKAAPLFESQTHPYIIDEATGAKCIVPAPPKVGQLRTTRKPIADRNYFMIFANPGQQMKAGSKITVIAGDLKIEHLILE